MRISDWSSDVCSSDLVSDRRGFLHAARGGDAQRQQLSDGIVEPSAKRETGDGGEEWAVKILGEIAGTDPAADQRGQHEARARLDEVAAGDEDGKNDVQGKGV